MKHLWILLILAGCDRACPCFKERDDLVACHDAAMSLASDAAFFRQRSGATASPTACQALVEDCVGKYSSHIEATYDDGQGNLSIVPVPPENVGTAIASDAVPPDPFKSGKVKIEAIQVTAEDACDALCDEWFAKAEGFIQSTEPSWNKKFREVDKVKADYAERLREFNRTHSLTCYCGSAK